MMNHEHIRQKLSPKQAARARRVTAEVEAEADDIKAQARETFARLERIESIVEALVRARQAKGVTPAEVARRTGMNRGNVSRLEGTALKSPNPTLRTLLAYADAIGVELKLTVVDKDARAQEAA